MSSRAEDIPIGEPEPARDFDPLLDEDPLFDAGGPEGEEWRRGFDQWWEATGSKGGPQGARPRPDIASLLAIVEALRPNVPRELEDQFRALVRELLLTVRAFIDWNLARLDAQTGEPTVEDIPID